MVAAMQTTRPGRVEDRHAAGEAGIEDEDNARGGEVAELLHELAVPDEGESAVFLKDHFLVHVAGIAVARFAFGPVPLK